MTIKEIEELTGMDRATVRFYEREGLIAPGRMDNGYREYSEGDLQALLRVKLLRSLHISLDEIRALKDGRKDLGETLAAQIERLEREKQGAAYAQDVCRAMREDRATFKDLNAKKYLEGIDRTVRETGNAYFTIEGDYVPQAFYPWRRFLARMLDIALYTMLWSVLLAFAFHVNLAARSSIGRLFDTFVALGIMLVVEPLLLHLFGTTLGKSIFGLRVESEDGRRLTYSEGRARTWGVIGAGMGYNIPVYNLVRLRKSYKLCSENETQPWDESISYTIKDTKVYRGVVYAGAYAVLIFLSVTIMSAQRIPPHRGDLTVAEFAGNHNYYADLFGIHFGDEYLDQNGEWAEKGYYGAVYTGLGYMEMPEYRFRVEDGHVTGVSFSAEIENKDDLIESYEAHMMLASLAFAGAQDEMGVFSQIPKRIADQIGNHEFEDFEFTEAGIAFACDTEYAGYIATQSGYLFPEEDAEDYYFSLVFSMDKLE